MLTQLSQQSTFPPRPKRKKFLQNLILIRDGTVKVQKQGWDGNTQEDYPTSGHW